MPSKLSAIKQALLKIHPETAEQIDVLDRVEAFTRKAFGGKKRLSGKDYHEHHNLSVAQIVAQEMELGLTDVCVAILHDVLEDTVSTREDIAGLFRDTELDGEEVAWMVEGLSKIGTLEKRMTLISDAQYIQKLMGAVSDDVRVMVVKIADVLHNSRDLRTLPRYRQKRYAFQTVEIWCWLSMRFGMARYFRELARISLWAIDPKGFARMQRQIASLYLKNLDKIETIKVEIVSCLQEAGIPADTVVPRMRHVHSLLLKQGHLKDLGEVPFRTMSDLVDFQVVLEGEDPLRCYGALGTLHARYRAVQGEFQDYISDSKLNQYQALHTRATREEDVLNLCIQTREMHQIGEDGIVYFLARNQTSGQFEVYQNILKSLKEQEETHAFMGLLRDFLVPQQISVLTPKRDVIYLPRNASVIDFAFQIHTELGLRLSGCSINGVASSVFSKLNDGDRVEVMTTKEPNAKLFWREQIQTHKARMALQTYFHKRFHQFARHTGEALLDHSLTGDAGAVFGWLKEQGVVHSIEEMYEKIGTGEISVSETLRQMKRRLSKAGLKEFPSYLFRRFLGGAGERPRVRVSTSVVAMKSSPCCHAEARKQVLVGHLENSSVVVHDVRCKSLDPKALERSFFVEWDDAEEYCTLMSLTVEDRPGIMASITAVLFAKRLNIRKVYSREEKGLPEISFVLDAPTLDQDLVDELTSLSGVVKAQHQSVKWSDL